MRRATPIDIKRASQSRGSGAYYDPRFWGWPDGSNYFLRDQVSDTPRSLGVSRTDVVGGHAPDGREIIRTQEEPQMLGAQAVGPLTRVENAFRMAIESLRSLRKGGLGDAVKESRQRHRKK